ncbi:hypothetical protein CDL12_16324 [Handroanthus impetiginosus]|uniref:Uncharacterized protein n=1 Tax=Handroanthus impetiginosus TaxID=429701 RepID=A0A2G9H1B4_9LAMI|nr:hypothetical protein CDL12_16324 [Handroanthus impetiginosus]
MHGLQFNINQYIRNRLYIINITLFENCDPHKLSLKLHQQIANAQIYHDHLRRPAEISVAAWTFFDIFILFPNATAVYLALAECLVTHVVVDRFRLSVL